MLLTFFYHYLIKKGFLISCFLILTTAFQKEKQNGLLTHDRETGYVDLSRYRKLAPLMILCGEEIIPYQESTHFPVDKKHLTDDEVVPNVVVFPESLAAV